MKIVIAFIAGIATLISGSYLLTAFTPTEDDIGAKAYSDYEPATPSHINKVAVVLNVIVLIAGIFTLIITAQSCLHL